MAFRWLYWTSKVFTLMNVCMCVHMCVCHGLRNAWGILIVFKDVTIFFTKPALYCSWCQSKSASAKGYEATSWNYLSWLATWVPTQTHTHKKNASRDFNCGCYFENINAWLGLRSLKNNNFALKKNLKNEVSYSPDWLWFPKSNVTNKNNPKPKCIINYLSRS